MGGTTAILSRVSGGTAGVTATVRRATALVLL